MSRGCQRGWLNPCKKRPLVRKEWRQLLQQRNILSRRVSSLETGKYRTACAQSFTIGIRLASLGRRMKTLFIRGIFCLLLLASNVGWADAPALSSSRSLLGYLDPRTWPFIPVPEVGTDPNGGTTVGILPVFLFVDAHQQVNRIVNGDLTYNSTLGIGGSLQILSYPSQDTYWSATAGATEHIARTVALFYSTGLTREHWWSFEGRLLFDRDPTERFFGLGNRSQAGNETNYTLEQEAVTAHVGLNLTRQLQLALDL